MTSQNGEITTPPRSRERPPCCDSTLHFPGGGVEAIGDNSSLAAGASDYNVSSIDSNRSANTPETRRRYISNGRYGVS